MRLFKPAELLAMRAVGEEADGIVFDGAHDQRVNAVEKIVGGVECSDNSLEDMDSFSAQGQEARFAGCSRCGCAFDLHVTESVIAEARMPLLLPRRL